MARKKKSDIVKVGAGAPLVPDYMQDADVPTGLEELKHFVKPPRMKIVQKQAGETLLSQFSVGDVILVPQMSMVAEMGRDSRGKPTGEMEPFLIVPVFFYPEWCTWNPIAARGTLPAIRERSLDPNSIIARKSRDSKLRQEACPDTDDATMRHTEHLNYVVFLVDHALGDQPVIMSFSRGEHGAGARWGSIISARKAPLYGGVYAVSTGPRSNAKGDWYGYDVANPPPEVHSPWVDAEMFETLKKVHLDLAQLHKDQLLRTDYEDADAEAVESVENEDKM